MKIDVSNMPINILYRFDVNKYVWSTLLTESKEGKYKTDEPQRYTEVYEITDNGYIKMISSGRLLPNVDYYDYSRGFSIWDYDQEKKYDFKVTTQLEELKLKDLYEIRDAVALNYRLGKK